MKIKKHLFSQICIAALILTSSVFAQATKEEDPLKRLLDGNLRFSDDNSLTNRQHIKQLERSRTEQKPFAIIVSCSDSRVPSEILFDQGIGDLFVVRVAGNVVGPVEMDSIEFAANNLGSSLVFVLGHQNCGAVNAVLQNLPITKEIENIVPYIEPAVKASKNQPGDPLENAIKANVHYVVDFLKKSTVLAPLIQKNGLKIAGGYFHIDDGRVELLDKP